MHLVVGASGLVGSQVCRFLIESGRPVRALVRSTTEPSKVEHLQAAGAEIVRGDLKDAGSIVDAVRGVSTVISTASSTLSRQPGDSLDSVDRDGQLALVEAAEAAGVEHFVFVSFRKQLDNDFPLDRAKRAVEERLQSGSMAYTILQASYFMEVWLGPALGFDAAGAKATIYGEGTRPISWISAADVARFAVAALDVPAARNRVVAVGGPAALSPLEVVRIFEEVGGTKFELENVPEEAIAAQKEAADDPMDETFSALMLMYARGDEMDMSDTAEAFSLSLKTVREFAESQFGPAPGADVSSP